MNNSKLARAVEPGNLKLINYSQRCQELRARDLPTLPSTIGQKKRIGPFLRTRPASVAQAANGYGVATPEDEAAVFAAIRQWKNEFR